MSKTSRISMDLGNPLWLRLLKTEAQETDSTMRDVLIRALEGYFAHLRDDHEQARWVGVGRGREA
jgi:hypothetical protein